MGWKETCCMDERVSFVAAYLRCEETMTVLCESYGTARAPALGSAQAAGGSRARDALGDMAGGEHDRRSSAGAWFERTAPAAACDAGQPAVS